ncbi:MAG: hypothetical protein R6V52_06355 [Bacteroidales bacterium]
MKKRTQTFIIILCLLVLACAPAKDMSENGRQTEYSVQLGYNHGGIVESRGTTDEPELFVDAYTGATKPGINAGAHLYFPLGRHGLETGVEYMLSRQRFTYHDTDRGYDGERDIYSSQFMLPLTFNITILNSLRDGGIFQYKIGGLAQANLPLIGSENGRLPDAEFYAFSCGFLMGISSMPFDLQNGGRLGFYADIYRGSQIYHDVYNDEPMTDPGSSFYRIGFRYEF